MKDYPDQGSEPTARKGFSRFGELPLVRYWKWSRYTKGSYRNMWKGLLKTLKGIAYILILLYSVAMIPDIPPGMGVLVILIGLKGAFNLARGIQLSVKARRMAEKSRGEKGKRSWKYFLLWTNSTYMIAIISLSFLFIVEHLKAPQEIRGDQPWYIWPAIYLGVWLVWSIVARSMVLGGARAFKVGDRLAKVHHDQMMLRKVLGDSAKRKVLLATGYVPLIGLAFMIFLIILLKMLLRYILKAAFDIDSATSIGESIIRLAFGPDLSLLDLSPFFGTWIGPLVLYVVVVFLICLFAYLRSFAMIRAEYGDRFHSHLGKRFKLFRELRRDPK
ncbi:MAG: hypothetical protein ACMUHU_00155 [Thermoplasmatota archaeon]